jgi:cytochrome c-type biogenesis protein
MTLDTILTSIALGLVATTSPCVLPLYPGFLAYLTGGQEALGDRNGRHFLGFFVLAGVLSMMIALGGLIALLSISIGSVLSIVIPISDLLILTLGIFLLVNINPFKSLPQIRVPVLSHPFINAYLYGLLYGPIALPCSGPLVVGIFAYSLTAGEALGKLAVFLWFGLGFGLPLLMLSFLSGALQRKITRFLARRARLINLIGGLLLVGIALYDLAVNWELITSFLGR